MIKHFKANKFGRDFIIGDLHGRLDLLIKFTDAINFDFELDRMFSVGDLIDRGPDSFKCLRLIEEPWFHCVKGNHEQLMEDWMTGGRTGRWWLHNGGHWFFELDQVDKDFISTQLLPLVQKLPWLITVQKKTGCFHVLHAEIPELPGINDETLKCKEAVQKFLLHPMGDGESGIWGRELWGALYAAHLDERKIGKIRRELQMVPAKQFNDKLSIIFSGHTTMRQPTKIAGQVNLDTGAFRENSEHAKWACLTVTEPETGNFWKVTSGGIEEVKLLTIT